MQELWQLFSEAGEPLRGQGETKSVVLGRGLLHGASHIWLWKPLMRCDT